MSRQELNPIYTVPLAQDKELVKQNLKDKHYRAHNRQKSQTHNMSHTQVNFLAFSYKY